MKKAGLLIGVIVIAVIGFYAFNGFIHNQKQAETPSPKAMSDNKDIRVIPISHATLILDWNDTYVYSDPTGGAEVFSGHEAPDIILITDIHGDHLSVETLESIVVPETKIYAPQAVADQLTETLLKQTIVINNGEVKNEGVFAIQAIPMYNIPESEDSRHTKGRGNGYVLESASERVYIAGDTAGIPEMRALQDIDIAFIPMNLPFTMDVEEAADAVLEFKPKRVYPFHYRGSEGLADTGKFKTLVNNGDPEIDVVLLNWYPGM